MAHATAWGPRYEDVLASRGVELSAEVRGRWTGEAFDGIEHGEHSQSRDHYVSWERSRLADMVRECGVGDDDVQPLVADLYEGSKRWTMEAYPEVPAVLEEVKSRGATVVVCSNWDWDLDRALTLCGLSPLIDVEVTSARAGARKPHPHIYRYALAAAGATPSSSLFVGDTWGPDVEGPLAAGMQAVHVWRDDRSAPDAGRPPSGPLPPGAFRTRDLWGVLGVL